jgi:hypothetical protein
MLHFLSLTGYTMNALNSDMDHVACKLNGFRNHGRSQESKVSEGELIAERHNMFRYKLIEMNTGQNKSILKATVKSYLISR